jgi:hypothetical protein
LCPRWLCAGVGFYFLLLEFVTVGVGSLTDVARRCTAPISARGHGAIFVVNVRYMRFVAYYARVINYDAISANLFYSCFHHVVNVRRVQSAFPVVVLDKDRTKFFYHANIF